MRPRSGISSSRRSGSTGTFVSADEAITYRTALPHASSERASAHPPRRRLAARLAARARRRAARRAHLERPGPPRLGAVPSRGPRAVAGCACRSRPATVAARCRRRSPRPAASPTRSGSRGCSGRSAGGASWATAGSRPATRRRSRSCRTPGSAVVVLTNATPGGTWLGRERSRGRSCARRSALDDAPPAPAPGLGRRRATRTPAATTTRSPSSAIRVGAKPRASWCWSTTPASPSPAGGLHRRRDRSVWGSTPRTAWSRSSRRSRPVCAGSSGATPEGRVAWLRWGGRLAPRLGD